ncbi:MAG: ABC transporter ATP-binding protein [Planctomycetaceae bacterium]|jgi:peptide/nickel transport system ATP-binding protein|nr:ABC transporter ATP-binding protein [Planctomycetaceae bacterium]MBT6487621.1 ABC transporter ATP-binding protein [Planctomycetaceae bacterium]MBT6495892.1 ABC transporter ATP-binding protein [Planctomycetaceae bacterium]
MPQAPPLIEIEGLKTYFHTDGEVVRAVDDLNISIREGQTLGLVGESGSGKSVTSLTIMRLLPDVSARIEAGSISFLGRDLVRLPKSEMCDIRGSEISMIFQEPGTSLNPVYRAGAQVGEAIRLHENVSKDEARLRTIELFKEVGIPEPERRIDSYPHEMSGGQKQRVMIAMALSCNPKLLIADEPTTALDVTIQAQILDLIRKLRDERGMSILFITHDLGVIAEIADDVAVMFRGKLVEKKPILELFQNPEHAYTKGLLACRPKLETTSRRLPTVADFMDIKEDAAGNLTVIEKKFDEARLNELSSKGRGRLLHPKTELAALGHPWDDVRHPPDTTTVPEGQQPVLRVDQLKVYYPIKKGVFARVVDHVRAVDGISFNIYKGQTLGLVGESGCGKTTTGRALLRLVPITEGQVAYENEDVRALGGLGLRKFRRQMQIIFQDPYNSLNPRMTIEAVLMEAMTVHRVGNSRPERRERAAALLEEVGLEADHLRRYPHEFSGGQRQRLCIARSLSVEPDFLICDESVSALDVSVQAQVLNLLKDLQEERALTYIFISHDLSVVKFMSDMMAVMNEGKIVEFGPSDDIYAAPKDDYTKRLIDAIPNDSMENIQRRQEERRTAMLKRTSTAAD